MDKRRILGSINFGERVAEEETDVLTDYFVETDHWQRLYGGSVDIVYGPKGSGKSALYSPSKYRPTAATKDHPNSR